MIVLRILLFPFAVLYDLVTFVRNRLYDLGLRPSVSFELPVISVGNLAVGGTGKTPLVEHLLRLLSPTYKVAVLSRGYGRKTRGFRAADSKDNASTIGDEPFQFYRKFSDKALITVGEERALAIPMIIDSAPETQVIIMDDAFQHRKVRPSFSIVLTDYNNLFFKDFLLPAGRLREGRDAVQRADVIVVTKCPDELGDDEMMKIEHDIREYTDKPVFFARIHYVEPVALNGSAGGVGDRVVLVSGIANAKTLVTYVQKNFNVIKHFNFADHYDYTEQDLKTIADFASENNASILTTEKDAVKLDHEKFKPMLHGKSVFYIPIEPEFIKSGRDFDAMVSEVINRSQSRRDDVSEK